MQNTKGSVTLDGASEGLLNKWELAAKLRIGKRTVDLWMHQKRLPFIRIGRTIGSGGRMSWKNSMRIASTNERARTAKTKRARTGNRGRGKTSTAAE
jgi:hypothetical protein